MVLPGLVWSRIYHEGHEDHEGKSIEFRTLRVRRIAMLESVRSSRKFSAGLRLLDDTSLGFSPAKVCPKRSRRNARW